MAHVANCCAKIPNVCQSENSDGCLFFVTAAGHQGEGQQFNSSAKTARISNRVDIQHHVESRRECLHRARASDTGGLGFT